MSGMATAYHSPILSVSPGGGVAASPRCQLRMRARLVAGRWGERMRVLLSTIGSRGDVEPLLALALELQALGQNVSMCAPPDFREWIESFEIPMVPIGP